MITTQSSNIISNISLFYVKKGSKNDEIPIQKQTRVLHRSRTRFSHVFERATSRFEHTLWRFCKLSSKSAVLSFGFRGKAVKVLYSRSICLLEKLTRSGEVGKHAGGYAQNAVLTC